MLHGWRSMALARARAVEAESKIHRAHHRISQNFPCFRRGHQWSDLIRVDGEGVGGGRRRGLERGGRVEAGGGRRGVAHEVVLLQASYESLFLIQ